MTLISDTENNVCKSGAQLHGGLERAADRFGDRPAVRAGDDQWSFRDLDGWSNAFARHLSGRGVTAGHRVVVMTANRVEFLVAVEAISKMGAAAVLLSPAWKATEVGHALEITGARHAVAETASAALLVDRLGPDGVTDLDDPATVAGVAALPATPVASGALDETDD
ncbi:MAG: AMP-binding protein, partial [Acidimicrobiales bacterium]